MGLSIMEGVTVAEGGRGDKRRKLARTERSETNLSGAIPPMTTKMTTQALSFPN